MTIYFRPASYQIESGKWVPLYQRIVINGPTLNERKDFWDKEFDTQEEADQYATEYCLQQGYVLKK